MAKKPEKSISDIVVFMTAHHYDKTTATMRRFIPHKKNHISTELAKHHIEAVMNGNVILSQYGRMDFSSCYDKLSQKTKVSFTKEELAKESHEAIWEQMKWAFSLQNEMSILFDNDILKPSFFYKLTPFRTVLQERLMEVYSVAFMLTNGVLCTAFSLYDCEQCKYITAYDVCGLSHHFHLFNITQISYDGANWFSIESNSIPNIIANQIGQFSLVALNIDFIRHSSTYYHSMLIMKNKIDDYEEYAHSVIGADVLSMPLENIAPTNDYKYFSQECFAIITAYDKKNYEYLLYRHIALESLKVYYLVSLIVSYEKTTSLSLTYQQILRLDILEHMLGTPLLTVLVLNNIKKMSSYIRIKEAMDFKITYLNTKQEERRNHNATLLNLLLYVLTLVSTMGTVYDLAKTFNWSIPWVTGIVIFIFVLGGVLWLKRESNVK